MQRERVPRGRCLPCLATFGKKKKKEKEKMNFSHFELRIVGFYLVFSPISPLCAAPLHRLVLAMDASVQSKPAVRKSQDWGVMGRKAIQQFLAHRRLFITTIPDFPGSPVSATPLPYMHSCPLHNLSLLIF